MQILRKSLKILGLGILLFVCFGPALLILMGVDFPVSRKVGGFAAQGYYSVWWGRLLLAAFSCALGWLLLWLVIGRAEKRRDSSLKKVLIRKTVRKDSRW